jgi:pimeloyl-ACP methyl ester carboxylesterase
LQYDLIGRGHSKPSTNNQYSEKEHIDQLRNLIQHLGFNKLSYYHVVGISMGGALASLYCEKYFNEVKSLTLLAPAGLMNLPQLEFLRALPFLAWIVKYPLQWQEAQPSNSKTFYDKTGIFEERFNYMMKMKRLTYDNNPHQLDASFQSKMQFPVYGIESNVHALGNIENFPIHVIFGN